MTYIESWIVSMYNLISQNARSVSSRVETSRRFYLLELLRVRRRFMFLMNRLRVLMWGLESRSIDSSNSCVRMVPLLY